MKLPHDIAVEELLEEAQAEERKPKKRCRYCGEELVIEAGPHRAYKLKRGQFCGRECYRDFLKEPSDEYAHTEPSDEQKAEWEERREEIWQKNFGHLERCGLD